MHRRLTVGVALLGLIGAACSSRPSPLPSGSPAAAGPTPTPVVDITGPTSTPTSTKQLTATTNEATMTVTPQSETVAAGGKWTVDVELRNDRDVPLIYGDGPCSAFASLAVTVPIPLEPDGAPWSGMEADFKAFALTNGLAGGGVAATDPMINYVFDRTCPEASGDFKELAPGASVSHSITWTAEIIGGLDALPGPVDFLVSSGIDPDRTEPPTIDSDGGPIGMWFPRYTSLSVTGVLRVDQPRQAPISIGEAIDSVLGDVRFTGWLASQPGGTCTGVNVLLQEGQAGSLIPPGPNWEIDVFCETGVPRHWAISTVDPFSAEVTGVNFCDIPCDR